MSRFGTLLLGAACGGAMVYGGFNYHVLRTSNGVEFVPKLEATLEETYLDVRQFGVSDWAEHEQVARAVVKSGKDQLLKDAAARSLEQGLDSLWDRFRG